MTTYASETLIFVASIQDLGRMDTELVSEFVFSLANMAWQIKIWILNPESQQSPLKNVTRVMCLVLILKTRQPDVSTRPRCSKTCQLRLVLLFMRVFACYATPKQIFQMCIWFSE